MIQELMKDVQRKLSDQIESWLLEQWRHSGLSLDQLADRYYLEVGQAKSEVDDKFLVTVTQTVRLVPKGFPR